MTHVTGTTEIARELKGTGYVVLPGRLDAQDLAAARAGLGPLLESAGWGRRNSTARRPSGSGRRWPSRAAWTRPRWIRSCWRRPRTRSGQARSSATPAPSRCTRARAPGEAHTLSADPAEVRRLPGRLQELLGFNQPTPYLGFINGRHPRDWLMSN